MVAGVLAPGPIPPHRVVERDVLLAALKKTGVSQSELARRLGAAYTTVNRWCKGHAAFSKARWLEVKQALALATDWEPTTEERTSALTDAQLDETAAKPTK